MSLDDRMMNVIDAIYDCAMDRAAFERAVESFLPLLDARWAMIAALDKHTGQLPYIGHVGLDERDAQAAFTIYKQEMEHRDIVIGWIKKNPHAGLFSTGALFKPEDLPRDEYVRANETLFGSRHWSVAYSQPHRRYHIGIAFHRTAAQGEFEPDEKKLISFLFGHADRALRVAAEHARTMVAREADGVIYLDAAGAAIHMNPQAETILQADDGLRLTASRIKAARSLDTQAIDRAIRDALTSRAEGALPETAVVQRPSGRTPYLVSCASAPRRGGLFDVLAPAVVVSIVDPDYLPQSAAIVWGRVFGLTPAENNVVKALVEHGSDLRRAAASLGIAYETARGHIRSAFVKTGTHSQAQLLRLLLAAAQAATS